MNPNLLAHYNEQLKFIRELSEEFSNAHNKIAGNLSTNIVEDPHVARLIEGFALLNARTNYKLDTDFIEFNNALLNNLYPQYQASIPSMSIVQLVTDTELATKQEIPAETLLITDSNYDGKCFFTTRYPVTLWPIEVKTAILENKILKLSLSGTHTPNKLRFYINAALHNAYLIYELLFQHTVNIQIGSQISNKFILQKVGFAKHENMLPEEKRTFSGYNLLNDCFVIPEKFLFFDISIPVESIKNNSLEILFYLNKTNPELEKMISANNFLLGCTPIVNIFPQQAEPITLAHAKTAYRVIPNVQAPSAATEIYSIKSVTVKEYPNKKVQYQPFCGNKYSPHHQPENYWTTTSINNGIYLSLMSKARELNGQSLIAVDLLCSNGDLPTQLPFGGEEPRLQLITNNNAVKNIKCLIPLTRNYRLSNKQIMRWQLISHLLLNHSFFSHDVNSIKILTEILNLYDFTDSNYLYHALLKLTAKPVTQRISSGMKGNVYLQGTEINLEVDPTKFTNINLFLFGSVLEHFFAQYTALNSFAQLVITSKEQGEIYRWLPSLK